MWVCQGGSDPVLDTRVRGSASPMIGAACDAHRAHAMAGAGGVKAPPRATGAGIGPDGARMGMRTGLR
jgi:hypothetical protein